MRLKPGMTVSCEYITWESDDAMYVPNSCILEENRHFYVYARKRGKLKKTEVVPGPSNNSFTVVGGDVNAGQELVLPSEILTN
ncbi:MAG: efflux RND transporter periplasmic adaptor subunit [Bacteroidales bacterium]|nr:efflux RND transporter periplasmic adaptor subunit [Bacteroidales bacterium]